MKFTHKLKQNGSWFLSLGFFVLFACDGKEAQKRVDRSPVKRGRDEIVSPPVAPSPEAFRKLYIEMSVGAPLQTTNKRPQERAAEIQVGKILPRMHGWLSEAHGLVRVQKGEYEILTLRTMPDSVLEDLKKLTFDDTYNSSLLLFQRSFWEQVAKMQKDENMIVGFVSSAPLPISGVYMHSSKSFKAIAFDVHANSGTLVHERRHQEQHQLLDQFKDYEPQRLSWACLDWASAAFGELDATTVQLDSWKGAARDMIGLARTRAEFEAFGSDRKPIFFSKLPSNLEYPKTALSWIVDREECPQELKEVAKTIQTVAEKQRNQVVQHKAYTDLESLFNRNNSAWNFVVTKNCAEKGSSGLTDSCVRLYEMIDADLLQADVLRGTIEGVLSNLRSDRAFAIKQILDGMEDREMHSDLCRKASGFFYLTACDF